MKILGLSFFYHDSAAALVIDGVPVAMAEEERFSRKKHDSNFPKRAINFVLDYSCVKFPELDYIVFYEKPFIKLDRIFKTSFSGRRKLKRGRGCGANYLHLARIKHKHLPEF